MSIVESSRGTGDVGGCGDLLFIVDTDTGINPTIVLYIFAKRTASTQAIRTMSLDTQWQASDKSFLRTTAGATRGFIYRVCNRSAAPSVSGVGS